MTHGGSLLHLVVSGGGSEHNTSWLAGDISGGTPLERLLRYNIQEMVFTVG